MELALVETLFPMKEIRQNDDSKIRVLCPMVLYYHLRRHSTKLIQILVLFTNTTFFSKDTVWPQFFDLSIETTDMDWVYLFAVRRAVFDFGVSTSISVTCLGPSKVERKTDDPFVSLQSCILLNLGEGKKNYLPVTSICNLIFTLKNSGWKCHQSK